MNARVDNSHSVVNVRTNDQTFLSSFNSVADSDKVAGNDLFIIIGRHFYK